MIAAQDLTTRFRRGDLTTEVLQDAETILHHHRFSLDGSLRERVQTWKEGLKGLGRKAQ